MSASSFSQVFRTSLRREAARLRASPWDLAMISWVPMLAVLLIWWIFSAGQPFRLPIGVLDQDHSTLSRQLVRFLDASPGLHVTTQFSDESAMDRALAAGEVEAALLLPRELSRDILQGRAATVVLLHNAQLGTHSSLIQRDVRTVVGTLSAGIEIQARNKRGASLTAARTQQEPIRASMVSLFNTALDYEQFLGVALIPALLHILAMTAGACAVGRELRDRSLGDWLGSAPSIVQALAALLGKLLLPWLSLSAVAALILLWVTAGRGWHPQGSLAWTFVAFTLLLALTIAMGAVAAAATRSMRTALSATGFITAPAFAFGGVGFPIQSMPLLAQAWALALPYTHYVRLQSAQLQMGAPLSTAIATPFWMAVITALLLVASAAFLKRAAGQPDTWGGR